MGNQQKSRQNLINDPGICISCKSIIPIEFNKHCYDCRLKSIKIAHLEHIKFNSDIIAGKYGSIDEDEYKAAEDEIARVRLELDQIYNGTYKISFPDPVIEVLPQDKIYSEAEKDRLALYRRVIANGDPQTENISRENGENRNA